MGRRRTQRAVRPRSLLVLYSKPRHSDSFNAECQSHRRHFGGRRIWHFR